MKDKKLPELPEKDSILAAMFTAGVLLSGTSPGLETFAAGWATGFKACLECLGKDWRENVGMDAIGPREDGKERTQRLIAGGCLVMENYDNEQEYWAKQELDQNSIRERREFLDEAKRHYDKFSKKRAN